jgi:hypothetical protein
LAWKRGGIFTVRFLIEIDEKLAKEDKGQKPRRNAQLVEIFENATELSRTTNIFGQKCAEFLRNSQFLVKELFSTYLVITK